MVKAFYLEELLLLQLENEGSERKYPACDVVFLGQIDEVAIVM